MAFPSPSLTPPSLSSFGFQYTNPITGSTLTFGELSTWGVLKVEGLDMATVRRKDPGRARDYGELIGLNLYGGRDITIDFWMVSDGTSVQDAQVQLADVTVNTNVTDSPLWFKLPNLPVMCAMCRPIKRTMPWDGDYANASVAKPTVTFHADDPRLYAGGQQVTIDQGGSSTGGIDFNLTFPFTGGASSPNSASADNAGNTPVNPIVIFTGPLTNPSITNASIVGNPTLQFVNPYQTGYTVLAGDQLVVDLDMHTILYYAGGISSGASPTPESGWLNYAANPVWWTLPPLTTSEIQLNSSDSTSTGGSATVQWASAWML